MTNPEMPNSTEDTWDDNTVYGPSTVIAALDQIQVLIDQARQVPLSASVILSRAGILNLLDQAREALPDNLLQADLLVADTDQVVGCADSTAESILAEANARAESTLQRADEKAEHIVANAVQQAERTIACVDKEVETTLQQARAEAEAILVDANAQAERLITAENIMRMAEDRVRETITEAREQDQRLREGADDYIERSLSELSGFPAELQRRTQAGRRTLAERHGVNFTEIKLDNNRFVPCPLTRAPAQAGRSDAS